MYLQSQHMKIHQMLIRNHATHVHSMIAKIQKRLHQTTLLYSFQDSQLLIIQITSLNYIFYISYKVWSKSDVCLWNLIHGSNLGQFLAEDSIGVQICIRKTTFQVLWCFRIQLWLHTKWAVVSSRAKRCLSNLAGPDFHRTRYGG